MDIDIQTEDPVSGSFHTISSFTQVTGDKSGGFTDYKAIATGLGGRVRVVVTLAGTAKDYTFSIGGHAKRT
jgi:hypothetical protein